MNPSATDFPNSNEADSDSDDCQIRSLAPEELADANEPTTEAVPSYICKARAGVTFTPIYPATVNSPLARVNKSVSLV